MPLYMDIHELRSGTRPEDVAEAHAKDVQTQTDYGVEYIKYWVNPAGGKLFCLCHAPSPEAAMEVHRKAHGLVAERIICVEADVAEAFLGEGVPAAEGDVRIGAERRRDSAIRTVLFTDIVGSTSLTQRLGDVAAMEIISFHDAVVRNALGVTGGREVKHTGDGIMAAFLSTDDALRCAARIQADLDGSAFERGGTRLRVRIGAATGEPVEHHNDLFGATVQLAARLCAAAAPDEVLIHDTVIGVIADTGLPVIERDPVTLKGFDLPQRVAVLDWRKVGPKA